MQKRMKETRKYRYKKVTERDREKEPTRLTLGESPGRVKSLSDTM